MREVPSPGTRRALIERGDVQVSFDIPDHDDSGLVGKADVFSTPVKNCIHCACLNSEFEPFHDPEWAPMGKQPFEIVIEDLLRIPLYQLALNVAINGASGYEFWFRCQLDPRRMTGA